MYNYRLCKRFFFFQDSNQRVAPLHLDMQVKKRANRRKQESQFALTLYPLRRNDFQSYKIV